MILSEIIQWNRYVRCISIIISYDTIDAYAWHLIQWIEMYIGRNGQVPF